MLRYCGSWSAAFAPTPLCSGAPPQTLLAQEFIKHSRLYKVYAFRGRVNKLEARAPLDGFPGIDDRADDRIAGRDFNSQTCAAVKRRLDEEVPEPIKEKLKEIARQVYAQFRLSYIGIDVIQALSGELLVCDVNYMSGPKESEAHAVAEQAVEFTLHSCVDLPATE